jgi:fructose-bisphosphate aldolase class II
MTLSTTAELLRDAVHANSGIAALNVITLEQVEAVLAAAEEVGRPVIVQLSQNAVAFHGGDPAPLLRATTAIIEASTARASVHLDHSTSLELCRIAAAEGASSVMFDASELEFEANVAATANAADWAHDAGVLLEAELGAIGGKQGAHTPGVRTDPREAREFVARTGVDALAVAVGSEHAQQVRETRLDLELIAALHGAVPVPLVLHGSSGVPDEQIAQAVCRGITKVNVGTALNVAFTGRLRAHLAEHPAQSDPRPGVRSARTAMAEIASALLRTVDVSGDPQRALVGTAREGEAR